MNIKTAEQVNAAHLGRYGVNQRPDSRGSSLSANRVRPQELVRRYGMWAYRCINLNAQAAAAVPFKLMQRSKSDMIEKHGHIFGRKRLDARTRYQIRNGWDGLAPGHRAKALIHDAPMDDLVQVTSHPALELLQDVNDWTEGASWRESVYVDLGIYGKAYTHVVADGGGVPAELWRMLPHMMSVVPDPVTFIREFQLTRAGGDVESFEPDKVLWFRLMDPEDPWGGLGPTEAWLATIDSAMHIQAFQNWLMTRGGSPDYMVLSEKPMGEGQKRSFRKSWQRLFGRMFRREESIGFLSGGTLERLGQTNRELEFNDSAKDKRDEIGQAYGVPKAILTSDDVNRSNAREAQEQHCRSIWPMVQKFEDTLNERLLSRFEGGVFLVHESPVPRDETIRIQERKSQLESGYTVNEVRVEDGNEPIDDEAADQPMVASGLTTLEQAVKEPEPPVMPGAPVPGADATDEAEPATDGGSADEKALIKALEELVRKFDPNQPRDADGRWTDGRLSGRLATSSIATQTAIHWFDSDRVPPQLIGLFADAIENHEAFAELALVVSEAPGSAAAHDAREALQFLAEELNDDFVMDHQDAIDDWQASGASNDSNTAPEEIARIMSAPMGAVISAHFADGSAAMLGTNILPDEGPWRVTRFGQAGRPTGHTPYESYEDGRQRMLLLANRPRVAAVVQILAGSKAAHLLRKAHLGAVADDDYDGYQNPTFEAGVAAWMRSVADEVRARLPDSRKAYVAKDAVDTILSFLFDIDVVGSWIERLADLCGIEIGQVLLSEGEVARVAVRTEAGIVGVGTSFDLSNTRAQDYVQGASKRIGRDATNTWADEIKAEVKEGLDNGESNAQIAHRIQTITDEFTPAKAEMIARTETAFAQIAATELGWAQSGVVSGKVFVCAPECCPFCQALEAELGTGEEAKSSPLFQSWGFEPGKVLTATFETKDGPVERKMTLDYEPVEGKGLSIPPVHPHCRCSLRPVMAVMEEARA